MELKKELEKLNKLKSINANKFEAQYLFIKEKFTSPSELQIIDNYINNMLSKSTKTINTFIEETIKLKKIA